MKIKEGFRLRTICGENIVVGEGLSQVNFNKMIVLNDSAAFLFGEVQGKEFTAETLAELLEGRYEVDHETALKDSRIIVDKWKDAGIAQ